MPRDVRPVIQAVSLKQNLIFQSVSRGQRNGIGRHSSLKSCPGFLCRSKSCRSHHLHTDKALSVAERRKTGSAGGFVEAESDCQSVPNYLSMENV